MCGDVEYVIGDAKDGPQWEFPDEDGHKWGLEAGKKERMVTGGTTAKCICIREA